MTENVRAIISDSTGGPRPSQHESEAQALAWADRRFVQLPVAGLLGARAISCDPVSGRMRVAFTATHEFTNLIGSVQGGLMTAMLDLAMSFAALVTLDDDYVVPTLEIKTTFISPGRPGEIVGDGMVLRKGRSVV